MTPWVVQDIGGASDRTGKLIELLSGTGRSHEIARARLSWSDGAGTTAVASHLRGEAAMNSIPASVLDDKHGSQPQVVPSNLGASRSDSAGARMAPATVCHADETVGDVIGRMRRTEVRDAAAVYVLDAERRLVGQVPLMTLLCAPPQTRLRDLATEVETSVTSTLDQEHAASVAVEHRAASLPVVDDTGRLVGVLPSEVLMDVLRAEHLEDLHRLAGVTRDQKMAREAIEAPAMRRARNRLPWLLIGLAGSAAATMVMAGFESTLQTSVAVAFFVPGIVYLADAIGTQTEAAAVRGLSLTREPLWQLVGGELRTGLLMGVTLAALTLPTVWLAFGDLNLAFAVAGALLCAGAMATTIGLLLPWFLSRMGRDPAYGSGPLATVIQDVLSIIIYLTIVTLMVR